MERKNIFGIRLKELREKQGLTQGEIGAHLGTVKQTVHNWEALSRLPSVETIWDLADFFDVSIDYLVGRKER